LKKLVATFPSKVYFGGKAYIPCERSLNAFKRLGILDVERLLKEGKFHLNTTPFTQDWVRFEGRPGIFTGQVKNNKPNGFVRVLSDGYVVEGFMN